MTTFKIIIRTRTADHDGGYCSGEENQPSVTIATKKIILKKPINRKFTLGELITDEKFLIANFKRFFKKDWTGNGDSFFCDKCPEWKDVKTHEYSTEVIAAILLERDD